MIKLTTPYGVDFYVNPDYIASISPDKEGSVVFIASDVNPSYVKESPDVIIEMIKSLNDGE